jgi:outer membrane protein assembly factor BamA
VFRWAAGGVLAAVVALGTAGVAPQRAAAQDLACQPGDVEVGRLLFAGNHAFDADQLENAIVTTPSSWARRRFRIFGTRRCLDRDEFPRDRVRLQIFYRKHGYYQAVVDTAVRFMRPGVVAVTFGIHEGLPVLIDTLVVDGLSGVRDSAKMDRNLPIRARGGPGRRNADTVFDRYAIDIARDSLLLRLRSNGYPYAQVLERYSADTTNRTASVGYTVIPGAYATIGAVSIKSRSVKGGKPEVPDAEALRLSGLTAGQPFSAPALLKAQRNLYETGAYRSVTYAVTPDSVAPSVRDTTVDVLLNSQEDYIHTARAGVGWGTIDCFRLSGQYTDKNFLAGARQLDLTAGLTKIGIGDPTNGLTDSFCAPARGDIYSNSLNYHVAATLRQARLFGKRLYPLVTLYSEVRSEYNAYLQTTPVGGTAQITASTGPFSLVPQYTLQYGKTTASPALLCAVFSLCQTQDQARVTAYQVLSLLSVSGSYDTRDDPLRPLHGQYANVTLAHAGPELGSAADQQFTKVTAEAAVYFNLFNSGNVLAMRARYGLIFGTATIDGEQFVPLNQRLYAGGPTTVRGFPQNQLGPVVYVTQNLDSATSPRRYFADQNLPVRVVPTGGNQSEVGNIELRLKSPFLPRYLGWTVFVDAGRVQPEVTTAELDRQFQAYRVTPGIGVRVETPIGPLRMDVGYNSYGSPSGPAYYSVTLPKGAPAGESAVLPVLCVSTGNNIPVTIGIPAGAPPGSVPIPLQPTSPTPICPASFVPKQNTSFFNRLNFNFSIGPAF